MNTQEDNFSADCQKLLQELIGIIKKSQNFIADSQKREGFQRFIGQEIYWIHNKWLETIFQQNFTHIPKSTVESIKSLLTDMKSQFQNIDNYIQSLKFDKQSTYVSQYQEIRNIVVGYKSLFSIVYDHVSKGNIKLDHPNKKNEYETQLILTNFEENQFKEIDQLYKKALEEYQACKNVESYKADITYVIIPANITNVKTYEADDIYDGLDNYQKKIGKPPLKKDIHLKKLEFYLDYDNSGQLQTTDIDDFITFVWCNPAERAKFLDEEPFFTSQLKPNKYKLVLSLSKNSKDWDPTFPRIIYIDENGYWTGKKDREKIRKPVRFGRRAQNNLIPCDIYFGPKEMTISKRQFVIKPDINEYYAYCISTTNPTEFLVKTDGAYVTTGSVITLSDKVCVVVTECVVKGEEEPEKIEIENNDMAGDGPTVRRGKKNNPALIQLQTNANKLQNVSSAKDYKEQKIQDDIQMDDEQTQKDEHKTYEKKKGGMKEIKEFFQKRINNEVMESEEDGQYKTQEWKKQKVQVGEPKYVDYRIIPNRDMTPKDKKMKDRCYLKLKLEWCDLDNEKDIEKAIENFNNSQDPYKGYFNIGQAKGCEICIDDSKHIKEFHCYFKYLEDENRWIVMDYNQNIMPMAVQKDQYTTIAFKGNHEKNHSELYKLQKGSVIVVSGNFLEVEMMDINLERNEY